MEGNWKRTQAEASMGSSMEAAAAAAGDWRADLLPEARQRIVNKIMETLERHLPVSLPEGLNELRKIAIRFEDRIYTAATSQSDYLRKISLKMISMETKTRQSAPVNSAGVVNQNVVNPASIESTAQTGHTAVMDWGEESSQKRMKLSEPVPEGNAPKEPSFSCPTCKKSNEKQKEPVFSCPICMCALASPFSTVCGHIFCGVCIKAAIQRRRECPTCRTKLTGRNNIHRVYLSTAD